MADEIADMVADLIVLIVDWKGAQDPMEVGFPISLVAAHGSAKGDDSFGTPDALARPDLNAPAGRALVVGARVAILGIIRGACGCAPCGLASQIDLRII